MGNASLSQDLAKFQTHGDVFSQSKRSGLECVEGHSTKKSVRNKRYGSAAQEIESINLDKLEVAPSPMKWASAERSTTSSDALKSSAKKSSDVSRWQYDSKTSATRPPLTKYVVRNKTEADTKRQKARQKAEKKSGRIVHPLSDDRVIGKLAPGYTALSMVIDEGSRL